MTLIYSAALIFIGLHVTSSWLFDINENGVNQDPEYRQYSRELNPEDEGADDIPLILRILRSEDDVIGTLSELHAKANSNRRRYQERRHTRSHWHKITSS